MKPFTKLFSSIISSSIWRAPNEVRLVWVTMLAMADRDGEVWASVGGLADLARVSRDDCASALQVLLSPDDDSRTKEHEGRRIVEIDGGWRLINYSKYREMGRTEDRRDYYREHKRQSRAKAKESTVSTVGPQSSTKSPIAEAEAEAEADTRAHAVRRSSRAHEGGGEDLIGEAPPETGTPVGVGALAPADLSAPLRQIWVDIAVDHGHEVATRARDATKRLFGACTPARMRETFSAAYERQALNLPADQWPDFRTAIRAERAGLNGAPAGPIDPERAAARKAYEERRAKENNHVAR